MATISAARLAANKRYNDKAYDHITIAAPKGTKDAIQATGESLNAYINKAIQMRMDAEQEQ